MKPGERWHIVDNGVYSDSGMVAECGSEETARLIAALPDLVEALRRIKDRGCKDCNGSQCVESNGLCDNLIAADALRKAVLR